MENIYILKEGTIVFCHRKETGYGRIKEFHGDFISVILNSGKIIHAKTKELSRVPHSPKFNIYNLPTKHRIYAENELLQEQISLGAYFGSPTVKRKEDPLFLKGLQQTDFILPSWLGKKPDFKGRAKSLWAAKYYKTK